jgi:hypothetical protein
MPSTVVSTYSDAAAVAVSGRTGIELLLILPL